MFLTSLEGITSDNIKVHIIMSFFKLVHSLLGFLHGLASRFWHMIWFPGPDLRRWIMFCKIAEGSLHAFQHYHSHSTRSLTKAYYLILP